jgi:hypothetical protein
MWGLARDAASRDESAAAETAPPEGDQWKPDEQARTESPSSEAGSDHHDPGNFYCAARALGAFDGPGGKPLRGFWDVFCIMPIVNTLTALPISLAGIGIRESLFQVLLKDLCGIAPGVGAATGSLGFVMRAVWGLPGGVLLLRYRASERRNRSQ